uniref:Putative ovule protein n=1 Tax=Solanum chacoense TaxID=4108 RepID=A0A0V0HBA2_SOLCH
MRFFNAWRNNQCRVINQMHTILPETFLRHQSTVKNLREHKIKIIKIVKNNYNSYPKGVTQSYINK